MDNFRPLFNWVTRHPVTSLFITIDIAVSFCITYMVKHIKVQHSLWFYIVYAVLLLFGSYDISKTVFGVVSLLLYSGVEKSVGSLKYLLWIFITTLVTFAWRILFSFGNGQGFVFPIFSPFFTFWFYHKPYYYFQIKNFDFDDRLFYLILLIQSFFICGWQNLVPCLFGNIIMLILEKMFGCCCRSENNVRRTDIGAEEELPELPREENM